MTYSHIDRCLEHAVHHGTQSADETIKEFKASINF